MARPPGEVTAGLSDSGRTVFLTVGERLLVDLGPGWTAPDLSVPGGDPGPVTTPLRLETGPPGNQTATTGGTGPVFLAVSAHNTLITAHPDPSASAGGQTPPPGST